MNLLRLRRYGERFRQSLFFLPAIFVLGSIALGFATVAIDRSLSDGQLPSAASSTVDNARSILSTVAGGTIGAASVVFSLTLVAVQLASSQFSPRVVRGFLGDRFQQVVMGVVVGTFTYSLVVLRVVQEPLDDSNAEPFLPQVSVLIAILLAVLSLLAVLASIDHTAKSLRVGTLLDGIVAETVAVVEFRYPHRDSSDEERSIRLGGTSVVPAPSEESSSTPDGDETDPPADALVVRSEVSGWVTQISLEGILEHAPERSTVVIESPVGTYLYPGSPLVSVWPVLADQRDHVETTLRNTLQIGPTRTLQQDVSFGTLQLTDIALRALSPGVNDPNTAIESIVRIGRVLSALLQHDLNTDSLSSDNRTIIRRGELSTHDYVDSALEPIRRYAKSEPVVLHSLVRTLGMAADTAKSRCETSVDVSSIEYQLDRIAASLDDLGSVDGRNKVQTALDEVRRVL